MSAIVDPAGGDDLFVHLDVYYPELRADVGFIPSRAEGCTRWDPAAGSLTAVEECFRARDAAPGADGTFHRLHYWVPGDPNQETNQKAIWRDGDDTWVLGGQGGYDLRIAPYNVDEPWDPWILPYDRFPWMLFRWGPFQGADGLYPLELGGGDLRLVERIGGQAAAVRMEASDRMVHHHAWTAAGGRFSVLRRTDGVDLLRIQPEGRVDRMIAEDDGWTAQRLADLEVPAGHFLVGAFEHAGQLLAFTAHRPADAVDVMGDLFIRPDYGDVYTWTATLPAPGAPEPAPAVSGITATAHDGDVHVCWPAREGAASLDGWTLAGAAPAQVLPGGEHDECVFLVRDRARDDDLSRLGAYAIEGTIPGAGRVRIGLRNDHVAQLGAASLPHQGARGADDWIGFDGGVLGGGATLYDTVRSRFSPGGVFLHGMPSLRNELAADLSGAGAWTRDDDYVGYLVDATGMHAVPDGFVGSVVAPGGGQAYDDLAGTIWIVAPDGTRHDVARPDLAVDETWQALAVMGEQARVCGVVWDTIAPGTFANPELACLDAGGQRRIPLTFLLASDSAAYPPTIWAAVGDTFYASYHEMQRIDTATGTSTTITPSDMGLVAQKDNFQFLDVRIVHGVRGTYLITRQDDAWAIVALHEDGGERLDLPELDLVRDDDFVFLVEPELFLILPASTDEVIRVPRRGR